MKGRSRTRGERGRPRSVRDDFSDRSVKKMRDRAYKFAVEHGTSPEEAKRVFGARVVLDKTGDEPRYNHEENVAYYTKYSGEQEVPSYQKRVDTGTGTIFGHRKMTAKAGLAHELHHAAQGERFWEDEWKGEQEAERLERAIAGEEVSIGMHPGQKGQHFFEIGVTAAAPQIQELFYNTIQSDIRRLS